MSVSKNGIRELPEKGRPPRPKGGDFDCAPPPPNSTFTPHPPRARLSVYTKTDGRCWYCGGRLAFVDMTIDHVKPLSRGGTWDDLNLVPSCFKCNHEKGDLSLKDFRKTLPDKKVYGEQYVHWLTYKRKNNR